MTEGAVFDEGAQTLDAAALEPAFRACDSFDAMASVLTSLPDVPADLDAEAFAREQSESVDGLSDTPVCQSLS